jgi:RNA polymerase sigma factor (TIGR02999 family)
MEGSDIEKGSGDITRLLRRCADGERAAFDRLIDLVYGDLRRIAHRRLRDERAGHTLDTTALVHETYLKLLPQAETPWGDRAHFFAVAARAVRQVLIDYARYRKADKRWGGIRIPLGPDTATTEPGGVDLLALEQALERLGELDPRLERVVECRFFGGMTVPETAEVLGVSTSTVDRDWARAKTYLRRELVAENPPRDEREESSGGP